jgi:hypothetical protein
VEHDRATPIGAPLPRINTDAAEGSREQWPDALSMHPGVTHPTLGSGPTRRFRTVSGHSGRRATPPTLEDHPATTKNAEGEALQGVRMVLVELLTTSLTYAKHGSRWAEQITKA